ncbi:hypothetical protein KC19_2G013500 [Ceratodon purpureus]|uniref:Uncharacterized protein n=1 Tax=Ceratodon purpureus TaxID=3225 RepID=A0A8T0INY2_CERPU|nr:hypothetical protein KC19_2G013500 [Ceratodon purpureus]
MSRPARHHPLNARSTCSFPLKFILPWTLNPPQLHPQTHPHCTNASFPLTPTPPSSTSTPPSSAPEPQTARNQSHLLLTPPYNPSRSRSTSPHNKRTPPDHSQPQTQKHNLDPKINPLTTTKEKKTDSKSHPQHKAQTDPPLAIPHNRTPSIPFLPSKPTPSNSSSPLSPSRLRAPR